MANWTTASLTVILPKEHIQSFLDAVKGPQDWRIPVDAARNSLSSSDEEDSLSAHDRMELIAQRDTLEEAFRTHPVCIGYPEWMPFSMGDAEQILKGEIEEIPETILSIPRLNPIAERAEFDRFFPGQIEDGYWKLAEDDTDPKNIVKYFFLLGTHGMSLAKLGAHSILFNVGVVQKPIDIEGQGCLHFQFEVKNGSVTCFPDVLPSVLEKFDAKALHVWEHNCENGGFDYINPAKDITISDTDDFHAIAEYIGLDISDEENGDEEVDPHYLEWSDVLLYAKQRISDKDFDILD